jgi:O-acetylhomoserine/O-acetylserine sulfhydrylase-like pyridoxal-dependent enzyme
MVAAKKFGKEANGDRALSKLLTVSIIEPLFKRIMNETDAGIEEKILNVPLSVSTLLLASDGQQASTNHLQALSSAGK